MKAIHLENGYYDCGDITPKRIILSKKKGSTNLFVRNKNGVDVPLDVRKYDREHKKIGVLMEKSLFNKKIDIVSEKILNGTDDKETIRLVAYENGIKKFSFSMSQRQAKEFDDFLMGFFMKENIDKYEEIKDLNTHSEAKVFLLLLSNRNYIVSTEDLKRIGVNLYTGVGTLRRMKERGVLRECGKIGNTKLYTCTIPKDKLKQMFGG